jgi:hypothetical protein
MKWHTGTWRIQLSPIFSAAPSIPSIDIGPKTFYLSVTGQFSDMTTMMQVMEELIERRIALPLLFTSSLFTTVLIIDPPHDILVIDPSGRRTGLSATHHTFQEIPRSAYLASDSSNEVVVFSPANGQYRIEISGTPLANFDISVSIANMLQNLMIHPLSPTE